MVGAQLLVDVILAGVRQVRETARGDRLEVYANVFGCDFGRRTTLHVDVFEMSQRLDVSVFDRHLHVAWTVPVRALEAVPA